MVSRETRFPFSRTDCLWYYGVVIMQGLEEMKQGRSYKTFLSTFCDGGFVKVTENVCLTKDTVCDKWTERNACCSLSFKYKLNSFNIYLGKMVNDMDNSSCTLKEWPKIWPPSSLAPFFFIFFFQVLAGRTNAHEAFD